MSNLYVFTQTGLNPSTYVYPYFKLHLDFEGKRLALDMLDITIWLDGENVEVTGVMSPEISETAEKVYGKNRK